MQPVTMAMWLVATASVTAGWAARMPPGAELDALQQRVKELERRMASLEVRSTPSPAPSAERWQATLDAAVTARKEREARLAQFQEDEREPLPEMDHWQAALQADHEKRSEDIRKLVADQQEALAQLAKKHAEDMRKLEDDMKRALAQLASESEEKEQNMAAELAVAEVTGREAVAFAAELSTQVLPLVGAEARRCILEAIGNLAAWTETPPRVVNAVALAMQEAGSERSVSTTDAAHERAWLRAREAASYAIARAAMNTDISGDVVGALARSMNGGSLLLRRHAAVAMRRVSHRRAISEEVLRTLAQVLDHGDGDVRWRAAFIIMQASAKTKLSVVVAEALARGFMDGDPRVRMMAAGCIVVASVKTGGITQELVEGAWEALTGALTSDGAGVAWAAMAIDTAAVTIELPRQAVEALAHAMQDIDVDASCYAASVICCAAANTEMPQELVESAWNTLADALRGNCTSFRRKIAVKAIDHAVVRTAAAETALEAVMHALREHSDVGTLAAFALSSAASKPNKITKEAVDRLLRTLRDPQHHNELRRAAGEAVRHQISLATGARQLP